MRYGRSYRSTGQKVNAAAAGGCRFQLPDAWVGPTEGGAAEELPFGEGKFDLVTIAFGARNFADLGRAMRECRRVLRPGGHLLVLEFTLPRSRVVRGLYRAYSATVMPLVGGLLSGSFSAYRYLPHSIRNFERSGALPRAIEASGMPAVQVERYTLGVVELVVARNPQ